MGNYLAPAIGYIQDNGDELERARLAGILGRTRPDPKVARTLLSRQLDDGGFPYGMIAGRPSAITATAAALQWMYDLRLLPSPHVERAAAFLLAVQRPDGSWDETPAVIKYDPPEHVRPGHPGGRTYGTALATFWLTRLLGSRHDAVHRAAGYLRTQRAAGRPADEPVQTTVLVTAAMAMTEGPRSDQAGAGMETLANLPTEVWTADRLAEALTALYPAAFETDDPVVSGAIRGLLGAQRPDGGWTSDQGGDHDVDLSLQALGALLAFGISSA